MAAISGGNAVEDVSISNDQEDNSVSFGKAVADWLEHVKPQVKESTYNKYRNLTESYMVPRLSEMLICDITPTIVETHCRYLLSDAGQAKTGLSAKTVSNSDVV